MEDYIYNTINDLRTSGEPLKYYGIRSVNCYAPVISSNTITPVPFNGNQPGASSDINTGIQIENTWAATLNCNVIRKTGTALVISGANPMATITNNDFVKSYYGIYTKNSGYTGDLGDATHPLDNEWVGILNSRQLYRPQSGLTELMYCRTGNAFWPFYDPGDPYIPTLVSSFPNISICPQDIVIDPIDRAKKTISQDIGQMQNDASIWVKKGMNKVVKNDQQLNADTMLSVFVDTLKMKPIGLLDSVLVLRENDMTIEAELMNSLIVPETNVDDLEKEMNQYFIKLDLYGLNTFSVTEIDRIREIAGLCPFSDGEAVYKARILAAAFDPDGTEYENVCERDVEDRSMVVAEEMVNIVKVVPNPSNGSFTFVSETLSGNAHLTVYDISGRIAWDGEAEINSESLNLDMLKSGLYHYSLIVQNHLYFGNITILSE